MDKKKIKESVFNSVKSIWNSLPMLLGVILLISLVKVLIPQNFYSYFFIGNYIHDSIVATSIGSILAGNPINSYIIGGELLKQGVSLFAVTCFIVAWVTVGVIQFPAEAMLLGKRFAIIRNISAFIFAIIVSLITIIGVSLL